MGVQVSPSAQTTKPKVLDFGFCARMLLIEYMAELVYACVSEAHGVILGGSSPPILTKIKELLADARSDYFLV